MASQSCSRSALQLLRVDGGSPMQACTCPAPHPSWAWAISLSHTACFLVLYRPGAAACAVHAGAGLCSVLVARNFGAIGFMQLPGQQKVAAEVCPDLPHEGTITVLHSSLSSGCKVSLRPQLLAGFAATSRRLPPRTPGPGSASIRQAGISLRRGLPLKREAFADKTSRGAPGPEEQVAKL